MVNWYIGTMGFSYKDWNSVFYPDGLASRDYLAHYSLLFNAVELDSTFYGTPRQNNVRRWAAVTPEGFKFCAKTPREITHELALVNASQPMTSFLETISSLGDKLGVILLQFPPDFTYAQFATLAAFVRQLPKEFAFAVEFRSRSWYTPGTAELLRQHGLCWAATDYVGMPTQITVTTDFLYIRWIGRHGRFASHEQEQVDQSPRLQEWQQRIEDKLPSVKQIYGFFNNDYAGHSPATANRFKAIAGLPSQPLQPPQQSRLL